MDNIRNKTVLITGASGDIGMACAEVLARAGARLILHSHNNRSKVEEFISRYRHTNIQHINCDVTEEGEVENQFQYLRDEVGIKKIDVLVNNAGDLIRRCNFVDMDWKLMTAAIDVNFKSAFVFTKLSLPLMSRGSSIIFMSSLTARWGKGDRSVHYGTAKSAILGFAKCLANELGPSGIRVNSVAPGFIKGGFHERYTKSDVAIEHMRRNPLKRNGIPDDVAGAVLFQLRITASTLMEQQLMFAVAILSVEKQEKIGKDKMDLYNHEDNISGPGSVWRSSDHELLIPRHKVTYNCLLSEKHYHVFVKYCFAKSILHADRKDTIFWRNIYDRMQISRIGVSKPNNFEKLICSFRQNGYLETCPIPVSSNFNILDGSHRLAASILFNLCPVIEVYRQNSHNYDRDWFIANGFSLDELKRIDIEKKAITNKCFVNIQKLRMGIVWGMSLEFWNEIVDIFSQYKIACCFIYDFIEIKKKIDFVIKSYKSDGMDEAIIKSKARKLAARNTKVGIILFNEQNEEELSKTKNIIREKYSSFVKDYFFDCILHLIDCRKTEIEMVKKFSSVYNKLYINAPGIK